MWSAIALVVGLALTPFLDYAWHAWIGHGPRGIPTRASHLEHHRTANEAPNPWIEIRDNIVGVGVAGVVIAIVGWLLVGPWIGVPFAAALVSGYVGITLSHARMHHRAPRTRWEHWFWRFHFHHHYGDPTVNYGLTSPLFDYVFRTAHVPDVVEFPEQALPAWWKGDGQHPGFAVRKRRS